jgi:ATP-dependent DNA helicase DinG
MLEVEVHSQLRKLLREIDTPQWIHHLTMARMVSRGIRLGKPTIIQTSTNYPVYCLSYLIPILLADQSIIIVATSQIQELLINKRIPQLQQWLNQDKIIETTIKKDLVFENKIAIVTPKVWLNNKFNENGNNIVTIIEECQYLPDFINDYLTQEISSLDWEQIQLNNYQNQDLFTKYLAELTQSFFAHPVNPYNRYLLRENEKEIIYKLNSLINVDQKNYTHKINQFCHYLLHQKNYFGYVEVNRKKGDFTLKLSPLDIKNSIDHNIWDKQPLILLANYLTPQKEAIDYRQSLGLDTHNFTCLKFPPHTQNENLYLYLPDNLPLPNNPQFQTKVNQEILALVGAIKINHSPIIILIEDFPLQSQITANLAAQFGSRVKLNNHQLTQNSILVCDHKFWLKHQFNLRIPQLLIMTTLPIPSLENPLISAQVSYYKSQKKDWFRLFLLPYAIKIMQQSTMIIRQNQAIFALLDNRVNLRNYGKNILQILEPYDRVNYLDLDWLNFTENQEI